MNFLELVEKLKAANVQVEVREVDGGCESELFEYLSYKDAYEFLVNKVVFMQWRPQAMMDSMHGFKGSFENFKIMNGKFGFKVFEEVYKQVFGNIEIEYDADGFMHVERYHLARVRDDFDIKVFYNVVCDLCEAEGYLPVFSGELGYASGDPFELSYTFEYADVLNAERQKDKLAKALKDAELDGEKKKRKM